MSRFKNACTKVGLIAGATGLAIATTGVGSAAAADGWVMGRVTVSTSYTAAGAGYSSRNSHAGYNFYYGAANGTVTGGIKVRWVKCGETSTQDGASSVGGTAKSVSSLGTIYTLLGTNFLSGSCVRAWARGVSNSGNFGYESYFNNAGIA